MSWPVVRPVRRSGHARCAVQVELRVGINPNGVSLKPGTPPPHPWFISFGPISFID
jgi:hypothetical protein